MSADPVSAGLDLGTEFLKFLQVVATFFPDYKQSKVEDYSYHHRRYVDEMKKDVLIRDDNRVDYHRDQMLLILEDFSDYIKDKSKRSV